MLEDLLSYYGFIGFNIGWITGFLLGHIAVARANNKKNNSTPDYFK